MPVATAQTLPDKLAENALKKGKLMEKKLWWKERVVYQIYPMSYCDSNGDGIGDLQGIISKLDYIKSLGVGAIWLSPVYASPNRDNGYDISDYCSVHENYGTLQDMDELIKESEKRDIKIIMDLVINHTSNEHEWFQKSRQKIEPYTDYYIWRKGKNGKKPNNWTGFFGEDCWVYDEVREEYYLHLFAKEQPDLNYDCTEVLESVMQSMRFWLERGVAGFRCDVINILNKKTLEDGKWQIALIGLEHYLSTAGTHKILNKLNREIFEPYNCYTVGETVFVNPRRAKDLTDESRGELNTVFTFEHMETDCYFVKWLLRKFSPDKWLQTLVRWQNELDWNTVYFENHDQPRSVSRFGNDEKYHKESAKALAVLLLSLKGTPYIFEGQEIGMTNGDFQSMDEIRDVESKNIWALTKRLCFPNSLRWKMIKTKSRDNARTPMQWANSENAGFTSGEPWLKVNDNYKNINVEDEEKDENSVLNFYRRFVAYRNESNALKSGEFEEVYNKNGVLIFDRVLVDERLRVAVNLTEYEQKAPIRGKAVFSNYEKDSVDQILLPYEAVVLKSVEIEA